MLAGGHWIDAWENVKVRVLHEDPSKHFQIALWRLEPGGRLPAHEHFFDEECFVLKGQILFNGQLYREGDFLLMAAGTHHEIIYSESGCLLYLKNEYIPTLHGQDGID